MIEKAKYKKLGLLFIYVGAASLTVYFLKPTYLISIIFVLLPPALLNFFWLKNTRRKVLVFSALTGLLFAPPIELISRLADSWDVQSVLPRPLGLIPLENMLFAFLNFFWVFSFYNYFVKNDAGGSNFSKNFRYLIGLYGLFSITVYSLYLINPSLIRIDYLILAIPTLVIPLIIFLIINPKLIGLALLPTIFFALVFFIFEMVSLQIGSWWWPGKYLWPVTINGKIFPLDDVIVWYLLSTPALIGGFEFFANGKRSS